MKNDSVKIYLDLEPINPKKVKRKPEGKDLANAYTVKLTRDDGQPVTEDEAQTVLMTFAMHNAINKKRP